MFFRRDAADAFYLLPSSTSCLDASADMPNTTPSSRQSFLRHPNDSLRGPNNSYACATQDMGYHTSHSSKRVTWPSLPQRTSCHAYPPHEGVIEPERAQCHSVNSYPRSSRITATPLSATATHGVVHPPSAYCCSTAPPFMSGSGVWGRADYLPHTCHVSSIAASSASVAHFNDAYRTTAGTSTRFAGAGANLPPQRVGVHNCNDVDGARAHRLTNSTTLAVARSVGAVLGTGSAQRPSSAPFGAPPMMPAAPSGRRSGASSAAYVANTYSSSSSRRKQLLPPPAPHSSFTFESDSQRVQACRLRTSALSAVPIHVLARGSFEEVAAARYRAPTRNGSGATPSTVSPQARSSLAPSSSAMHKSITMAALEQGNGEYAAISTISARPTRWSADVPLLLVPVRSALPDGSLLTCKGEAAHIARPPERLQLYQASSTVAEQDSRSGEADTSAYSGAEDVSAWWTVDIFIISVSSHCGSAHEGAAAMRAAALLRSPADMRAAHSIQCRAPVLPADASAEEAWDMTQSFLRCIALTSLRTFSPLCVPQGYFYFDTDFNQYVQLSADTLPLASTLFSVVMVAAGVDTPIVEEGCEGHAEMSDATAEGAQEVLGLRPCPVAQHHHMPPHASPPCDRDGAVPRHLWGDSAERGLTAITPRPPEGRPTSAPQHGPCPLAQPRSLVDIASAPSIAAGSSSRPRPAFDRRTSSNSPFNPEEKVPPYQRHPHRSCKAAVVSPDARGNDDSTGMILTYDGNSDEDGSYLMGWNGVENDVDDVVYGVASLPPLPLSYRDRTYGRYVDDYCAAWERTGDVAGSQSSNVNVVYIDDNEAVLHAEAEEVTREAELRAAKAAERQFRASYGSNSISSNPDNPNCLQRFYNAPQSSKPPTHPLPTCPAAHGLLARLGSDSRAPAPRRPTAPAQGYSHVEVAATIRGPSSPPLPGPPLQPPPQQLFFDDPILQRHLQSPFKPSMSFSRPAAGSAEGCDGGRYPTYVPSPPRTAPAAPSPPHGAYMPVAHPYFDPSSSMGSYMPDCAPTPRFSAHTTEASAIAMNPAQRGALNALLQRSVQVWQQGHSSPTHCRQPPASPISSGDVDAAAASPPVTTSTRPRPPRSAADVEVDSAASAVMVAIASTAYPLGASSFSSLSQPLPWSVTDATVLQGVVVPPPTSVELSTVTPMGHDCSSSPPKDECCSTTIGEADIPGEIEADALVSGHTAAAAVAALPEAHSGAVKTTTITADDVQNEAPVAVMPQDDQRDKEWAEQEYRTDTIPTLEGGEEDEEAVGVHVDTHDDARRSTAVATAATTAADARGSRDGGGGTLWHLADTEATPMPGTNSRGGVVVEPNVVREALSGAHTPAHEEVSCKEQYDIDAGTELLPSVEDAETSPLAAAVEQPLPVREPPPKASKALFPAASAGPSHSPSPPHELLEEPSTATYVWATSLPSADGAREFSAGTSAAFSVNANDTAGGQNTNASPTSTLVYSVAKEIPAADSSAPAHAAEGGDGVAASLEEHKESARTSPADTRMELSSSTESAEVEDLNIIPPVTAADALQGMHNVPADAPGLVESWRPSPVPPTAAPPAEYSAEVPRSQSDSHMAAGAEGPSESFSNVDQVDEVTDIAVADSVSGVSAHIVAAEAVGGIPATDSAAESVDTEQSSRQQEGADCRPKDSASDINDCAADESVARLKARPCPDDASLLSPEAQPSALTDAIAMTTGDDNGAATTREDEGEEEDLACSARPTRVAASEAHDEEHHAAAGKDSEAVPLLKRDDGAEYSDNVKNKGDETLRETAAAGARQQKEACDVSSSPQTLDSKGNDELGDAVAAEMAPSENEEKEEGSFSATANINTLLSQPNMAAAAEVVAAGGDATPHVMTSASVFLPAPVFSVSTDREKEEDPDAPPQVLHHRAAVAAAAAAANAFYGLWEEWVTEDSTGDGDDPGGAGHVDTAAEGEDEEERDPSHPSTTSEAVTTTTITTTQNDYDGAVDVPMDVFRDSLSLTNTQILIRRCERRDEDTSVSATASLADPSDPPPHTVGSDMRLPLAQRRVTLMAYCDVDTDAADALSHFHHEEVSHAGAITDAVGEASTFDESGVDAEAPGNPTGGEVHVAPPSVVEALAPAMEVPQPLPAPSSAEISSSFVSTPSSSLAASQLVASPKEFLVQTNTNTDDDGNQFSSAMRGTEGLPDATNDEPHVAPFRSAAAHVDGSLLPLLEVPSDDGSDGAVKLRMPTTRAASEASAADVLQLPLPPRNDGAMKRTMVLLGFPGSAWELIMTHHYEGMHDAFTNDSAVAASVPISAIQDVRYSKGSLLVDFYVLHPASVDAVFIRDQMSNYSYPTLWAFYEAKKREQKRLLRSHGMSVAGAVPVQCLPVPSKPALSSHEEVGWTSS
ncbi:hypothetical protein NXY56_003924 [Leishmania guyanensis]